MRNPPTRHTAIAMFFETLGYLVPSFNVTTLASTSRHQHFILRKNLVPPADP